MRKSAPATDKFANITAAVFLLFLFFSEFHSWFFEAWRYFRAASPTTYYVSSGVNSGGVTAGSDSNNCTAIGTPCRTLEGVIAKMAGGDILYVRQGEYDTQTGNPNSSFGLHNGTNNRIPNGSSGSWTRIWKYPSDPQEVVFRRFLNYPWSTEAEVASRIRWPSHDECLAERKAHGMSFSEATWANDCWGGFSAQPPGYLNVVTTDDPGAHPHPLFTAKVLSFDNASGFSQYIEFDGIEFDGKGITQVITFSCNTLGACSTANYARNITFKNGSIRNSVTSGIAEPGMNDDLPTRDLQFINMRNYANGVPNDSTPVQLGLSGIYVPARLHPSAKYLHGVYGHIGGNTWKTDPNVGSGRCEVYLNSGFGFSLEGSSNVVQGCYIHENAGAAIAAVTSNSLYENNILFDNVQMGIWHEHGAGGQIFRNNTIIGGPKAAQIVTAAEPNFYPYNAGIWANALAYSTIYENNIVAGYRYGIKHEAYWCVNPDDTNCIPGYLTANKYRNNVIATPLGGSSFAFVAPGTAYTSSGNILNQDPLFVDADAGDYSIQSGSPAATNPSYCNSSSSEYGVFSTCATVDYTLATRPGDTTNSIGAFQEGSSGAQSTNTIIDSGPANPTTSTSATFTFHGAGGDGGPYTFGCSLDGAGYTSCTTPKNYTSLSLASHTFCVRATDGLSEVDATPACYTWSVQAVIPPNTVINSNPLDPSTDVNPSFTFSATGATGSITFECSIDGGSYASCTSPKSYTSLTLGSHSFAVRAVDSVSGTDATPATYNWSINASGSGSLTPPNCAQVIVEFLNIRDSANGSVIGQHAYPDISKIMEGPVSNGGFTWIRHDFIQGTNTSLDGWTRDNNMNLNVVDCPLLSTDPRFGPSVKFGIDVKIGKSQ